MKCNHCNAEMDLVTAFDTASNGNELGKGAKKARFAHIHYNLYQCEECGSLCKECLWDNEGEFWLYDDNSTSYPAIRRWLVEVIDPIFDVEHKASDFEKEIARSLCERRQELTRLLESGQKIDDSFPISILATLPDKCLKLFVGYDSQQAVLMKLMERFFVFGANVHVLSFGDKYRLLFEGEN